MKTAVKERLPALETSNGTKSFGFRIDNESPKAFKVLIDSTYSDKIGSMIREICSNAVDAHNMNGIGDTRFKVKFPTFEHSEFVVRDYGPGISDEDIENVFTVLFKSTKEETQTGVGKYGLGAKSPFAYTDTFTVTSYQNGVSTVWVMSLLGSGVPSACKFMVTQTDQPDGLEVSIPIRNKDFSVFSKSFARQILGFDLLPEIEFFSNSGSLEGKLEATWGPEISSGSFIFRIPDARPGEFRGVWAKMGCVIYPVDMGLISEALGFGVADVSFLGSLDCLIEFPIGALEPVPSREHLSYGRNDPTIGSIAAALKELKTVISAKVREIVDPVDSVIGLTRAYTNMRNVYQKYINTYDVRSSKFPDFRVSTPVACSLTHESLPYTVVTKHGFNGITRRRMSYKVPRYSYSSKSQNTHCHPDLTHIFVNDLKAGGFQRVSLFMKTGDTSIVFQDTEQLVSCLGSGFLSAALMTSGLPKPERQKKTSIPKKPAVPTKGFYYTVSASGVYSFKDVSFGGFDYRIKMIRRLPDTKSLPLGEYRRVLKVSGDSLVKISFDDMVKRSFDAGEYDHILAYTVINYLCTLFDGHTLIETHSGEWLKTDKEIRDTVLAGKKISEWLEIRSKITSYVSERNQITSYLISKGHILDYTEICKKLVTDYSRRNWEAEILKRAIRQLGSEDKQLKQIMEKKLASIRG